jgi:hypothetical protein
MNVPLRLPASVTEQSLLDWQSMMACFRDTDASSSTIVF